MMDTNDKGGAHPSDRAGGLRPEPQASQPEALIPCAERFYIDCEFDGHGGPLLSIAMVHEGGCSIHVSTDQQPRDPWVQQNVMPIMDSHKAGMEAVGVPVNSVGAVLREWMNDVVAPVIIADSPVDIGRFCAAISTGVDGGWASTEYQHMAFEVHNVDCYPTDLPGAVQHNAWWDAMALRHKLASAIEARRAETAKTGSVHESAAPKEDAQPQGGSSKGTNNAE